MADIKPWMLRGELREQEPMSRHVSWRAGGAARRYYRPADLADLQIFLQQVSPSEPVLWMGLGSNLLVREGGWPGVVIATHGLINAIHFSRHPTYSQRPIETPFIYAEAGVASPKLARFTATHGLGGNEFLAGIPGTIGGALAMNAGCYGKETWERVLGVITLNRQGALSECSLSDYDISYRHVAARDAQEAWFVGAWFKVDPDPKATSREIIRTLLSRRIAEQPLQLPNAGSVFRNPPGDYAARLIESCGLKGFRMGDAQVSTKHANFIVNLGQASATQIETLIEHVQDQVLAETGIKLQPEVKIVGEHI